MKGLRRFQALVLKAPAEEESFSDSSFSSDESDGPVAGEDLNNTSLPDLLKRRLTEFRQQQQQEEENNDEPELYLDPNETGPQDDYEEFEQADDIYEGPDDGPSGLGGPPPPIPSRDINKGPSPVHLPSKPPVSQHHSGPALPPRPGLPTPMNYQPDIEEESEEEYVVPDPVHQQEGNGEGDFDEEYVEPCKLQKPLSKLPAFPPRTGNLPKPPLPGVINFPKPKPIDSSNRLPALPSIKDKPVPAVKQSKPFEHKPLAPKPAIPLSALRHISKNLNPLPVPKAPPISPRLLPKGELKPPPLKSMDPNNLSNCNWFRETLSREEATNELMRFQRQGAFMVRKSTKKPEFPYTLVLYYKGMIKNLPIGIRTDRKYALGAIKEGETRFSSVPELIDYHRTHDVVLAKNEGRICLLEPVPLP